MSGLGLLLGLDTCSLGLGVPGLECLILRCGFGLRLSFCKCKMQLFTFAEVVICYLLIFTFYYGLQFVSQMQSTVLVWNYEVFSCHVTHSQIKRFCLAFITFTPGMYDLGLGVDTCDLGLGLRAYGSGLGHGICGLFLALVLGNMVLMIRKCTLTGVLLNISQFIILHFQSSSKNQQREDNNYN